MEFIETRFVRSKDQLADNFTKSLSELRHQFLFGKLGVNNILSYKIEEECGSRRLKMN